MPAPGKRFHGGVRGSDLARGSTLFEGRFGRMFRTLPPADFGDDDAATLAALAKLGAEMVADADPPHDGADEEEGGIPAAYTYLGQFIDHDLTFDPASSLQRQNDPDALVDFRTPRFDLDDVYGRGPADQPYMYENGRRFLQGRKLTGAASNPNARDLPRSAMPKKEDRRAIIGDPRNDENVIVSELQGLFHRFHNKIADDNPKWSFERVQREVRWHYQWMVMHDFLPTIVDEHVLDKVLPHLKKNSNVRVDEPHLKFFHWKHAPYMPLEFSVACYRFGHSMVRPGYRLSETVPPLPTFALPPALSLTGFQEFPDNWAFDWGLFMDLEPRDPDDITRTQLAYRIDTSIVNPLGNLPPAIASNPSNLALRNLERGWRMRLPSGQDVARAMALKPLADSEIKIGSFTGDPADVKPITDVDPTAFKEKCPLWTYTLAETVEVDVTLKLKGGKTKKIKSRRLGPVGGRIVAEVFAGLLLGDSTSFVNQDPLWKPSLATGGVFGFREFILEALKG